MTQGDQGQTRGGRAEADTLAAVARLAEALPADARREQLVQALRHHLPRVIGAERIELGLVTGSDGHVECHVFAGTLPGEPTVHQRPVTTGCFVRVLRSRTQLIPDLREADDPELQPLVGARLRQRLVLAVHAGTATIGVLAVTSASAIRPETIQAATLVAAVLSARGTQLSGLAAPDSLLTLEAQLADLRSTNQTLQRTDALTRLPNRAAAFEAIGRARAGEPADGAFAYIDVDHLKMTNDRLGHGSGDEVLRGVADRLLRLSGPTPVAVFRVGGDEFGALSRGTVQELRAALEELSVDLARDPLRIDGREVPVAFSAGVYAISGHDQGIEEIVSRAESAAHEAKRSGRGRVLVHVPGDPGRADTHHERLQMDEVRSAVLTGRLSMVAQPIRSVVQGVEAPMDAEVLVRLADEAGRTLLPDDFVALAEQYYVVNALDRAVLSRVVETLADGAPQRRVSCNVSPHSLLDPTFVDWADDLIRGSGQGRRLVLELTERLPIGTVEEVRSGMVHLGDAGVRFALDDFGAGTTSYGNLRVLPIDVLKIDGVLVRGCLTSTVDHAMLRSAVEVADALGIRSVAEGVETAEQLSAVVELGAHAVQGYYFGQPLPWPAV